MSIVEMLQSRAEHFQREADMHMLFHGGTMEWFKAWRVRNFVRNAVSYRDASCTLEEVIR